MAAALSVCQFARQHAVLAHTPEKVSGPSCSVAPLLGAARRPQWERALPTAARRRLLLLVIPLFSGVRRARPTTVIRRASQVTRRESQSIPHSLSRLSPSDGCHVVFSGSKPPRCLARPAQDPYLNRLRLGNRLQGYHWLELVPHSCMTSR